MPRKSLGLISPSAWGSRPLPATNNLYNIMEMWRILVPANDGDGRRYHIDIHRAWDSMVRDITKGLTIHKTTKGQWVSPDGELFAEPMIPVDLFCTRRQILQIAQLTKTYYKQRAVLAYKISDEVIFF